LTDLAKDYRLGGTGLIMGGVNFAWLAVWVSSPDWPSRKLRVWDFFQALRWSRRAWGSGVRAVPPGNCLTTEENHGKPQLG